MNEKHFFFFKCARLNNLARCDNSKINAMKLDGTVNNRKTNKIKFRYIQ